jgi:hypothetical protein
LQFLAWLETHSFAGRNADFLAGARISSDAGLAGTHVKYTEAAQFDAVAFAERAFHGLKHSFDGLLGLGSTDTGFIYYSVNDIQLNHARLPLFNLLNLFDGKLC